MDVILRLHQKVDLLEMTGKEDLSTVAQERKSQEQLKTRTLMVREVMVVS
jgi:hypothetical protein